MSSHMYLKFEGPSIPGTGTGDHAGEIEVLSWNHGFVQPSSPTRSSAGSGTVEQAMHQNLTVTKYLDAATHDLLKYCWSGKAFRRVTLSCFRMDGPQDTKPILFLRVSMQHVVIANYSISGGPGDIPVENVSLDYGSVQYEYMPQKPTSDAESTIAPVMRNAKSRAFSTSNSES